MLVSAAAPLRLADRVELAGEILLSYLLARRDLAGAPIADVVAGLRSPARRAPLVGSAAGDVALAPDVAVAREQDVSSEALVRARRLARAVVATLRLLPGDTRCLLRSLVLTRLLARRGIPSRLVIAARTDPEFLAHAWVECGGAPVLDPGDETFGRLVEL